MSQVYLLIISESANPLALGRRRHTAVFATKELAVLDRDKYFEARCGYQYPVQESDDQNRAVAIRRDYYWKSCKKQVVFETFITAEISCYGVVENKDQITKKPGD